MESLSPSYEPRHYVFADTDRMSEEKIRAFESAKEIEKDSGSKVYTPDRTQNKVNWT